MSPRGCSASPPSGSRTFSPTRSEESAGSRPDTPSAQYPRAPTRESSFASSCRRRTDLARVAPHRGDGYVAAGRVELADLGEAVPLVAVVVGRVARLEVRRHALLVDAPQVLGQQSHAESAPGVRGVRSEETEVVVGVTFRSRSVEPFEQLE